ncbi:MAG TPA: 1,4-dihydroxy-2-naphthoate polyprenyltransferase [Thermoclostridium sp.]|nr:1,4-dihydroxy-2-naphthoate polyprenyltransferase [Clostridiaceae bacterium]HOQ75186.1 1,4-dihydroxy-2-naphthoate polyprenyltransferase [Thermoclostridium sp.]HPU44705.1 1,4-dihydroxy-2-naphthoate polyprenyltransferase [Thermoclostridium sp.]
MKAFLKLVEIHTKIASVTPFIWSMVFTGYYFGSIRPDLLLIFFASMISFDMFTTALNNYLDWKRARKKHGYNYEMHNAIVRYGMSERSVVLIITVLFIAAAAFGLLLFLYTDIIVLLLGMACFLTGILYSAGPLPISRTPLGEIFSGFVMGYLLPFIVIYFSISGQKPLALALNDEFFSVLISWRALIPITLALIPTTLLIAGIMLANNICDIDDDIVNKRYTLPVYIGKKPALIVYYLLYIACYLDILAGIVLGYLPVLSLITFVPAIRVFRNLREFSKIQTKKDTFKYAVDNLILVMAPLILSALLAWLIW